MRMRGSGLVLPAVVSGVMVMSCGCSLLSPSTQSSIEYYDLVRPEKIDSAPVNVEQFASFSGERHRMIRRKDKTFIRGSDFNKWLQSPGSMLTRYLRIAFRNGIDDSILKNADYVAIRGEVLVFEVNDGYAELGIRYNMQYRKVSLTKTVLIREKLERRGAEAFSLAMSRAANRFAKMVAAEANQIKAGRK